MKNEDIYADRNFVSRDENRKQVKGRRISGLWSLSPDIFAATPGADHQQVSGPSTSRSIITSAKAEIICDSSGFPLSRLSRE
jgi:hypothetical protein